MARYYAEIRGSGKLVSKAGTPSSGIWGHVRGWNIGVEVRCHPDEENPKFDVCEVYKTGGSNKKYEKEKIATIREIEEVDKYGE